MKQIVAAILSIVLIVSLIAVAFTIQQEQNERERLVSDLHYRSTLLAESFKETIEPNFVNKSDKAIQAVVERFANRERFAGLAVYDHTGALVAGSSTVPENITQVQDIATNAMDSDSPTGDFVTAGDFSLYFLAVPLHEQQKVVGALLVGQQANYIDTRLSEIRKSNLMRLFVQIALITVALFLVIRWLIFEPVRSLAASLKFARTGTRGVERVFGGSSLFQPLTNEVVNIRKSLIEARMAAIEEARASLEKMDAPWTAQRLREFIADTANGREIIIVSNREPYIHTKIGNKIIHYTPASGMVTALEPIIQAAGGTWIAYGSGDADKLVVDRQNRVKVPPEEPKYTLKRVWLTTEEVKHFYDGFCNEALWPLCHTAYTRPVFRKEDWDEYKKVNGKFAREVLSAIKNTKRPIILIQDFHFAMLPRMIKNSRPDATIGLFWHVPWVSAEAFSVCPWRKELIDGMLGADLLGFHTQLHCNNFIETVGRELEARIDFEQFSVIRDSHSTFVQPYPISIAFTNGSNPDQQELKESQKKQQDLLKRYGIQSKYIGIGVDRLDYTKGILERVKAIEIFLNINPQYKEQFTFVQIAAPSRTNVKKYRDFAYEVKTEIERINGEFKTRSWKPIILIDRHHSRQEVYEWYRTATVCLVTSLHDGMNLVAKEYIAAHDDNKGVLVLSKFAGASKELKEALVVNPYNGEQTAETIRTALTMPLSEQTKRMKKMRDSIRRHNVYRWSADFLRTMIQMEY